MRISLATKISLVVVGVLVLAVLSSVEAITSAYRLMALQETIVADNLASVRAAEELEISLLEQRGYVSSYMLDGGNITWLEHLEPKRQKFLLWLGAARATARSETERTILDQLEAVQRAHAEKRDEVVALYKAGQVEQAKHVLLGEVAELYDDSYDLCVKFINANERLVIATSNEVRQEVEKVTVVVAVTCVVTLGLGLTLLWLFFRGVIFPLRRIAAGVRSAAGGQQVGAPMHSSADMRELGVYVELLMANVAETRSDLEHSRLQLARAEKLAAVGKLAASVAHEIRNPLTSIKMWLYSLERTSGLNDEACKKLQVVSGEIDRLENVVHSFLEFSRPPQLNVTRQDVDSILDKTLELVKYRLQEQQIKVHRRTGPDKFEVVGDAEQLMQVFVNLINNAMEAMPQGGELRISTGTSHHEGRDLIVVRIADTGCGMTQDVQERVFEPFFTTKPQGTGLGLCIAASVMARHGGALHLESSDSHGTQWAVWIPIGTRP